MRSFYFVLISIIISKRCFGEPAFPKHSLENVLSYQQGFGFNNQIIRPSIDYNVVYNFLFNGGVNYQFFYGINGYLGFGVMSVIELQYGYAFMLHKHMLRIRSDLPVSEFLNLDLGLSAQKKMFLQDITMGIFIEHTFDDKDKGTTIGITFGYLLYWKSNLR